MFINILVSTFQIGYSDGITDGRESVFQKGFDQGYSDGLLLSLELKKYQKTADILLNSPKIQKSDDLRKELEELSKLDPRNQIHFKMLENLNKPIDEVSGIQEVYTNLMLERLEQNFPLFHEINRKVPN